MKLRNKKTGEIIDLNKGSITDVGLGSKIQLQATDRYNKPIWVYNSFAELNEEWEDAPEEPKEIYYLTERGVIDSVTDMSNFTLKMMKEIGNYFNTLEEAELAVRKLKAWKRLKDNGFRFYDWKNEPTYRVTFEWSEDIKVQEVQDDLDLLFGGEE